MDVILPFLFEVLLLYFLSRRLIYSIHFFLLKVTSREKLSVYIFALLFLPGTFIHELAHFLSAKLLFVPTGKFTIFPVIDGRQVKLGSVAIAQVDPIRRFLIGIAPIYFGLSLLIGMLFLLSQYSKLEDWQTIVLASLVSFEIGNTMFSSKEDVKGAVELLLAVVFITGLLYFAGVQINLPDWSRTTVPLIESITLASQILLVPIFVDLIAIGLLSAPFFLFRRK